MTPRAFMERLTDHTFLATQYMRHPSRPLYTPEPDVIHELVGHAVTFCHPSFARLNGYASPRSKPSTSTAFRSTRVAPAHRSHLR